METGRGTGRKMDSGGTERIVGIEERERKNEEVFYSEFYFLLFSAFFVLLCGRPVRRYSRQGGGR